MPIEHDERIKEILTAARTIAVIGASNKPLRDSRRIYHYLKREGYIVFPVNPEYSDIDGDRCYPSLSSLECEIDIVNVFRNPDAVKGVVNEAIAVKAKTLWLQLGVVDMAAARTAEQAGLHVIMNHCIAIDHSRLLR